MMKKFGKVYKLGASIIIIGIIAFISFVYGINRNSYPFDSVIEMRKDMVERYELLDIEKAEAGTMLYSVGKVNKGADNMYFVDMVRKSLLGYKWVGGGGHINRDPKDSNEFLFSAQLLNESQKVIPTIFGVFRDTNISRITVSANTSKSYEARMYQGKDENEKFYYISFDEDISDYTNFIFTIIYENGEKTQYVVLGDDEISKLQKSIPIYFTKDFQINNEKVNFISEAQLTDREKMFLSVGNNEYFAFDFSVNDKYKWVEVWIDRYELGKKASSSGKLSTEVLAGKGGMILAALREPENMKYNWTIAINNGNAIATGSFNQEYKTDNKNSYAKTWGANRSKNIIKDNDEITLASIAYKVQENGARMSSLTDEFYRNPDKNINEISDYNLVYLLKVRFYENNPNK